MRIIVVGAGAIGGSLAAELVLSGTQVVVVARGIHGQKIAANGLHYRTPTQDISVPMQVVPSISELAIAPDDIAILAMKIGDCEEAILALAALDASLPVLCLQNGVAAEAIAAKHLQNVYGGMVYLPATYLEAGVVDNYCSNGPGAIRIGPYCGGNRACSAKIASVLVTAGFDAEAVMTVMPWKHGKLLTNLGNALEVVCSDWHNALALHNQAIAEGETCLQAADIDYLTVHELVAAVPVEIAAIGGVERPGGSMWQSVARGRSPEVQYLNGAIVALGEAYGVPTPLNAMLVRTLSQAVSDGRRWTTADLRALI